MANRNQYDDDWDQSTYNNRGNYRRNRGWDEGDFTDDWDQSSYGGSFNRNRYYDRDYDWNRFNRGSYNRGNYNPDRDYDNGPTWTYYEFWYVPGPFTGVGPSGYERSDERISDDVHHRLTQHGQIDASNVHVDVNDGVVTLTGSVPDRRQKRLAEDLADDVPGVTDVHNNLQVERSRHGQMQGRSKSGMQRKQTDKGEIHLGMRVMGSDGKQAGTVKDIRNNDFLIDRSMDRDVYVPFSAIQSVQNDQIMLNIAADDVDNQNWPEPQVMGMGSQQGQQRR